MNWTREHLMIAMHLYCQIPFAQISHRNRTIMAVAGKMGRTSSSLSMKLGNFASFDPMLQARGIKGLRNASRADRAIWEEFHADWERATEAAATAMMTLPATGPESGIRAPNIDTDRFVAAVARSGQDFFRLAVLSSYRGACCVTGLAVPALLNASHIIPWNASREHRLNPRNGLCLSVLHDRAFDRGMITFDENFRLVVGGTLRREAHRHAFAERNFLAYEGRGITVPERFAPDPEAMRYHREGVFETP